MTPFLKRLLTPPYAGLHRNPIARIVALGAMTMLAAAGACNVERTDSTASSVLGGASFANCAVDQTLLLRRAHWYGRVAATSNAFSQCLDQVMRNGVTRPDYTDGPYRQCNNDPSYGQAIATQVQQALAMARNSNDFNISCTGGTGNASAGIDTYNHPNPDSLSFNGPNSWLASITTQEAIQWPFRADQPPNTPNTRWAPYAWPYSQTADILWHEASHQWGYTHGADDQTNAKINCGYQNDQTWNFQVNTAPYIIGDCLGQVVADSTIACGALPGCQDASALWVVSNFQTTGAADPNAACTCINDPNTTIVRPDHSDVDGDNIKNFQDNCPLVPNTDQQDTNYAAELAKAKLAGWTAVDEGHRPLSNDNDAYRDHWRRWYRGDACDADATSAATWTYAQTGVQTNCEVHEFCSGQVYMDPNSLCPQTITSGLDVQSYIGNAIGNAPTGTGTSRPAYCDCTWAGTSQESLCVSAPFNCPVGVDGAFPSSGGLCPGSAGGWFRVTEQGGGAQGFASFSVTHAERSNVAPWGGVTASKVWDFPSDLTCYGHSASDDSMNGVLWTHVVSYSPTPRTDYPNHYLGKTWVRENGVKIIGNTPCFGYFDPWAWVDHTIEFDNTSLVSPTLKPYGWVFVNEGTVTGVLGQFGASTYGELRNRFSASGKSLLANLATVSPTGTLVVAQEALAGPPPLGKYPAIVMDTSNHLIGGFKANGGVYDATVHSSPHVMSGARAYVAQTGMLYSLGTTSLRALDVVANLDNVGSQPAPTNVTLSETLTTVTGAVANPINGSVYAIDVYVNSWFPATNYKFRLVQINATTGQVTTLWRSSVQSSVPPTYLTSTGGSHMLFAVQRSSGPTAAYDLALVDVDGRIMRSTESAGTLATYPIWAPEGATVPLSRTVTTSNTPIQPVLVGSSTFQRDACGASWLQTNIPGTSLVGCPSDIIPSDGGGAPDGW